MENQKRKKIIEAYPYVDPSRPFRELHESEITFYLHLSNKTGHADGKELLQGKKTCGSACKGCYFQNLPMYEIPLETAKRITSDLRYQGYDVGVITADAFSDTALYEVGEAGSAFRLKDFAENNGNAWTSGYLLSQPGWEKRLIDAWNIGYGAITISLYATVLEFPITGIPKTETILTAVKNIKSWNEMNPDKRFKIIATARIFPHTKDLDSLRKLAEWCIEQEIDGLRWNAHANFQNIPEQILLELTASDIYCFYGNLAKLHEEYQDKPILFGISEDIGPHGIEQILPYLPAEWDSFVPGSNYWCRAGYRLFAINMIEGEIVITGCVDRWAPILGHLRYAHGQYRIDWEYEKIENLKTAIVEKKVYGCHGGVGFNHGRDRGFSVDVRSQKNIYQTEFAAEMIHEERR